MDIYTLLYKYPSLNPYLRPSLNPYLRPSLRLSIR